MSTQAEIQLAQLLPGAEPAEPGGGGGMFLLLGAMLLFMYALIIRPEQKRRKEHKNMLGKLKRGDMIVTSGGLHGKITGISDEILTVEIAERVRVKISSSSVTSHVAAGGDEEKKS